MRTRTEIAEEIGKAPDGVMEEKLVLKNILITLLDIRDLLSQAKPPEEDPLKAK